MWEIYKNLGGDSNIDSYEIGATYIRISYYGTPKKYVFSYSSCGSSNVEIMKKLAIMGNGLSGFIDKFVKNSYER